MACSGRGGGMIEANTIALPLERLPLEAIAIAAPDKVATTSSAAEFLDFHFESGSQAQVERAIAARRPNAHFAYVVTPNVDHLVRIQYFRSDLWPAYRHAWLTLCDSRILARMAAWTGVSLKVVPGSDLTAAIFHHVVRSQDRVAIVGGDGAMVERLSKTYGLSNVHHYDPPMGFIDNPEEVGRAVDFVTAANPRYTFIAVGSPQQEILAYRLEKLSLATGIGFCVGASLEFLTGVQTRAPRIFQLLSIEWLFRLLSNPRRLWKRYLIDGPLVFLLYWAWRRRVS